VRADRLLSILLLLQGRGKMTAQALAEELEVSERTVYRDIDALCTSGVPIYSESGHGGGYGLMEDYRTHLTGLNKEELRALMTLGSFAPLSDLGLRQDLRAALLKISAALPESSRVDDSRIQHFFHFDQTWWQQSNDWMPHLQRVQEALWENRKLEILYRLPQPLEIRHLVSPYGLVVKAGRWYLVCEKNGSVYVYRLSELLDVQLSDEVFMRPEGFDLAAFWAKWCRRYEGFLTVFSVTLEVASRVMPLLRQTFGEQVERQLSDLGPIEAGGWYRIEVSFESFEAAREKVLGLGNGVRVVAPLALQLSVQDYAAQILKLYQAGQI